MTTYVIEGISLDSFSTATLSFLAPDTRLKLDYTVNWREPDGLFNSSFDVSAYDIYLNGQSILAPPPFWTSILSKLIGTHAPRTALC